MIPSPDQNNEQLVSVAFNRQARSFDELYGDNPIIQYKRERVRKHIQQQLSPNSDILELNSGTGEDAIWLAQQGHTVHATDISIGMQQVLVQKVKEAGLEGRISTELISYSQLELLEKKKQYNMIFSNFAGLNCTNELSEVLLSFYSLLKPGGIVTLIVLPKFCLWEFLLILRGKFKIAFRRFFSKGGVTAHVEGVFFKCWYYDPSYIIKHLKNHFDLLSIEGLCTLVPPSYMETFPAKHPKLYAFLKKKEDKLCTKWPWKNIGDYYIISMKKK
jgi:ubiquinone/menaquinone biosynthesis C-methylase UbiE